MTINNNQQITGRSAAKAPDITAMQAVHYTLPVIKGVQGGLNG